MTNDTMDFIQFLKDETGETLIGEYPKDLKQKLQSDVCLGLSHKKTWTKLDFSISTVSKHILETKWASGKRNYSINEKCKNVDNDMRYLAFRDYESKRPSYFFIWGRIIQHANLEKLNNQDVILIPLEFVKENSISAKDLIEHYREELKKVTSAQ